MHQRPEEVHNKAIRPCFYAYKTKDYYQAYILLIAMQNL